MLKKQKGKTSYEKKIKSWCFNRSAGSFSRTGSSGACDAHVMRTQVQINSKDVFLAFSNEMPGIIHIRLNGNNVYVNAELLKQALKSLEEGEEHGN